ncbi:MAG: fibronectin type III domain-containing protein, partial [Desulfobulbaceae bacterium]|nr:fibronectin type III domain-containing protein [Desulfobulbaceae bacterium]
DYSQWLGQEQTLSETPVSWLLDPVNNANLKGPYLTIHGVAVSKPGIDRVEVSTDGGQTWQVATGTSRWSYEWMTPADGIYVLKSRVISSDGFVESPSAGNRVTVSIDEIRVSGTLQADETWSGQVIMEGDVNVPEGMTLIIQPGTTISVSTLLDTVRGGSDPSRSELIINGTLMAIGTAEQPITFQSTTLGGGSPGDWNGITVTGSVFLEYVIIQHAENALTFNGSNDQAQLSIKNCLISDNSGYGLNILASNNAAVSALVEGSTITNNLGNGINCRVTQGTTSLDFNLCNNTIAYNGNIALSLHADGSSGDPVVTGTICNNIISDHLTHGVSFNTTLGAKSVLTIDNNQIFQSARGMVASYNTSHPNSTLTVTSNDFHTGVYGLIVDLHKAVLSPHLESNEIHAHTIDGLRLTHGGEAGNILLPLIRNNQIYDNDAVGLFLKATDIIEMPNNSLFGNGQYDLYNDAPHPINARTNWWGILTTNLINNSINPTNLPAIYDAFDNANKGEVDYSDWLVLYDPPTLPTLDPVTSPTALDFQTLSGTKEADSGILINGTEVIGPDQQTTWSYNLELGEGINSLTIRTRTASGMVSSPVYADIVRDTTAPILYSSVPAEGAFIIRPVVRVDMTLLETTTELDPLATTQGSAVDQNNLEIPGSWSLNNAVLSFTPDTPLADGFYTVTINPTDQPLGNSETAVLTFTVDLSPPAVPTIEPYETPTSAAQVTLSGSKDSGTVLWMDDEQIIALDDTETWTYTLPLEEGENSHILFSKDLAGNQGESVTFTIISDRTAPVLSGVEPPDNSYLPSPPESISFIFTDQHTALEQQSTLASAEIFDAGGADIEGTWTLEQDGRVRFTPLQPFTDNKFFPRITARDLVGNATQAGFSFTCDTVAPAAPTLQPVQTPTSFVVQTLTGNKEAGSSIRINGTEVIEINSDTTWSHVVTLKEGINTFTIASGDRAGNVSSSVSATIQYDETAPLSVDTLRVDADGNGTEAILDWTGYNEVIQGDIDYYRIYISDALFTQVAAMSPVATVPAGTFTYTATGLTKNSRYYFAVVGVDTMGNGHTSVTPVTAVARDVEPPEPVTALQVVNNGTSLTFSWNHSVNSAGDLAGYRLIFNGGDPVNLAKTTNSYTVDNLAPSTSYPCTIYGVDGDENQSESKTITGVTVLPNPVAIDAEAQSGYVVLSWPGHEPADQVKYYAVYLSTSEFNSVQGMQPRMITTGPSARVARLTNDTTYFFGVTTVNTSNGFGDGVTSVSATPTLDQQGPEFGQLLVNGQSLTDGITLNRISLIQVQATDPINVSKVEFHLDGARQQTDYLPENGLYSWLWDIAGSTDGAHQLTLKAYDSLGNVSERNLTVNISLVAPQAPIITGPENGRITNRTQVIVTGTGEQGATIDLLNNGGTIATRVPIDRNSTFSTTITLNEGENLLQAVAGNRAGQSSPSNSVTVTLDTSLPTEPGNLVATPKAGGEIKLRWRAPAGESVSGYHVYRAQAFFSTPAQAQQLTPNPVASTSFTDLTPEDSEWFYRVSTVDAAGNEGPLSEIVSAVSDRIAPTATAVTVEPHGQSDGVRIAPGRLDINITVSEPLLAMPFVSVVPNNGSPYAVEMQALDTLTYSGVFIVTESTPSGTAYILFSSRDKAGNRGTEIESGASIIINN